MKPLFIYSVNDDIIERLKTALSESDYSIDSFSSLIDLQSALEQCSIVTLVFYLENNNSSESELATIQRDYKQKINTLVLNNTPTPEQGVRLLNLNIRGYTNSFIEPSKLITALSVIEQGEI